MLQHGKILRVVFEPEISEDFREVLREIAEDLCDPGLRESFSENIRRALEKFSPMSPPIGAAGLYFDAVARDFQRGKENLGNFQSDDPGDCRTRRGDGNFFEKDMVEANLKIFSNLVPEATTSMQRDVLAGKKIQKSTGWSMRLCG